MAFCVGTLLHELILLNILIPSPLKTVTLSMKTRKKNLYGVRRLLALFGVPLPCDLN